MPATKRPKPLYQRGKYSLYQRPGRANLEIVWYDDERKRERSSSAGTTDIGAGKLALDRLFLKETGAYHCPTCHRPWDHAESPLIASVIADYLVLSEGKAGEKATRTRLRHVIAYVAGECPKARCIDIDERWVNAFRKWLRAKPVISPTGKILRERSIGAVEGCILQLAAAINSVPGQEVNRAGSAGGIGL